MCAGVAAVLAPGASFQLPTPPSKSNVGPACSDLPLVLVSYVFLSRFDYISDIIKVNKKVQAARSGLTAFKTSATLLPYRLQFFCVTFAQGIPLSNKATHPVLACAKVT